MYATRRIYWKLLRQVGEQKVFRIKTSGFKSRWTTPWRWQNATTFRICTTIAFASSSVYLPPLEKEDSLGWKVGIIVVLPNHNHNFALIFGEGNNIYTLTKFCPVVLHLHTIWHTKNLKCKYLTKHHGYKYFRDWIPRQNGQSKPQFTRKHQNIDQNIEHTPWLCTHYWRPHMHHKTSPDCYALKELSIFSPLCEHLQLL